MNKYRLTHAYSRNPEITDVYVSSELPPTQFMDACAYIMYYGDELVEGSSVDEITIAMLIKLYFDTSLVVLHELQIGSTKTIDMHLVWEYSDYTKVMNLHESKNYLIKDMLKLCIKTSDLGYELGKKDGYNEAMNEVNKDSEIVTVKL
jgi:hypothetical protein